MDSVISSVPFPSPTASVLLVDPELTQGAYVPVLRASYAVAVTPSVATAEQFMERLPPTLVVAGARLEDGGAIEICRTAKSLPAPAPVLVTAKDPALAPDVIEAGCDGVLLKPFAPNLLATRVGRMVRARQRNGQLREAGGIRDWPDMRCPHCAREGVTSFDYASLRRAWYTCMACRKVWMAKRRE